MNTLTRKFLLGIGLPSLALLALLSPPAAAAVVASTLVGSGRHKVPKKTTFSVSSTPENPNTPLVLGAIVGPENIAQLRESTSALAYVNTITLSTTQLNETAIDELNQLPHEKSLEIVLENKNWGQLNIKQIVSDAIKLYDKNPRLTGFALDLSHVQDTDLPSVMDLINELISQQFKPKLIGSFGLLTKLKATLGNLPVSYMPQSYGLDRVGHPARGDSNADYFNGLLNVFTSNISSLTPSVSLLYPTWASCLETLLGCELNATIANVSNHEPFSTAYNNPLKNIGDGSGDQFACFSNQLCSAVNGQTFFGLALKNQTQAGLVADLRNQTISQQVIEGVLYYAAKYLSKGGASPLPTLLPSETPKPSGHHGLSKGQKLGIVLGASFGGAVILLLICSRCKKANGNSYRHNRSQRSEETPLMPRVSS